MKGQRLKKYNQKHRALQHADAHKVYGKDGLDGSSLSSSVAAVVAVIVIMVVLVIGSHSSGHSTLRRASLIRMGKQLTPAMGKGAHVVTRAPAS